MLETAKFPDASFRDLIYNYALSSIIFFGPECGGDFLPKLKLSPYAIKELKGVKFLLTDPLGLIAQDKQNEKRKLWGSFATTIFDVGPQYSTFYCEALTPRFYSFTPENRG